MGSPVPAVLAQRHKIAVVGFASNTRDDAPYKDESWEIFGLNNLWAYIPRWDRWFEMHDPKQLVLLYGQPYVDFLKSITGRPLYMQQHYDEYPASVAFPKVEMEKRVLSGREFWPSSISFMAALAIDLLTGPDGRAIPGAELGFWGVDLIGDDEYSYQREGCGHLIGVAEGRGIKVTIPEKASLLKAQYVYGYHDGEYSPDELETFLAAQAGLYGNKKLEALAQVHTYDGASQGFQTALTMVKHWKRGGKLATGQPTPPPKAQEAKAS